MVFAVPLASAHRVSSGVTLLRPWLSVLLVGVAVLLVVTEHGRRQQVGAACSLAASGLLGAVSRFASDRRFELCRTSWSRGFRGCSARRALGRYEGDGVPPQSDAAVTTPRRTVGVLAGIGTLCGGAVGYIPGISSAIAATLALGLVSDQGPRAFIVTTSGVNTATAVFALFALISLGTPRTGVLVALDRAEGPLVLPAQLAAVAIAAVAGAILVPTRATGTSELSADWTRHTSRCR